MTPARYGLTEAQDTLFRFIESEITAGRQAPSFTEMCHHLGCSSKSNVHRLVECLVERGAIVRLPKRKRSITLPGLTPSPAPAAPPVERQRIGISKSMAERVVAYCDRRGEAPREIVSRALAEYMRRNP